MVISKTIFLKIFLKAVSVKSMQSVFLISFNSNLNLITYTHATTI